MYLDSDNRPAITPQLAFRVAVIGGFALLMFAIIFFRLWYLQVLSGDKYLAEANNNRVREIKVEAPRGEVVDREGRVLVDNRPSRAVKISPEGLPRSQEAKTRLYDRLADVLDLPRREIRTRVREQLRAELVGAIGGPLSQLVGVFNGLLQTLVGTLEAQVDKQGGAQAAA